MTKCKMSANGKHNWYWYQLAKNGGSMPEVAERCKYCHLFAGTDTKYVINENEELSPLGIYKDYVGFRR